MRPYLEDLVARLADRTPVTSSDDSISWHACREAETLTDVTMVDELAEGARGERSKHRRAGCYFTIGKLGGNLKDARCATVLLELLPKETDKHNIASLLDRVGEIPKPHECDLSAVYALLSDERSRVRHSAIQALNNSASPDAEDRLLRHLAQTTDPYDQVYCHAVLNRIGTRRSLRSIEANLKSPKRDVKASAEAALKAILARHRS